MDPTAYTLVFTFMALCALIAAYRSAKDRHWVATTGMVLLILFLGEATRELWSTHRPPMGATTKIDHP